MYHYHCDQCHKSVNVSDRDLQPLSGVDKALCAKHGMDFTAMTKLTCPGCNQVALFDRLKNLSPASARPWWQF